MATFILFAIIAASQRPPVLQSVYFIPHVAVYMFAYLVIFGAFILRILTLRSTQMTRMIPICADNICDMLVKIGTVALGIGLCLGALWAKKAWGQYWSWDIKEIAALITWLIFLLYLHLAKIKKINKKILLIILIIGFLSLNFTWLGVKYLPVGQKSSHSFYSMAF